MNSDLIGELGEEEAVVINSKFSTMTDEVLFGYEGKPIEKKSKMELGYTHLD